MTTENSDRRAETVALPTECECMFFKALSPSDQALNRRFRQAAKEGNYDIPDFYNSLCGPCIRDKQIDELLQRVH